MGYAPDNLAQHAASVAGVTGFYAQGAAETKQALIARVPDAWPQQHYTASRLA